MTTYTFTGPDGRKYSVDGPPGQKEEAFRRVQQKFREQHSGATGLAEALTQGWIMNPVTAAGQMVGGIPGVGPLLSRGAEATGFPQWTAQYKAGAEANPWQRGVETTASVLNPLWAVAPEAGLTDAGAATFEALSPAARGAIQGAIGAALQPVEGAFSWGQKQAQVIPGMLAGGALGRLAGRLENTRAGQATSRAAREALAALEGRARTYNEGGTSPRTGGYRPGVEQLNEARQQRFKAAQQAHAQRRWQQQAAAHQAQLAQTQLDPQNNVDWMRRALELVGLGDKTPTQAGGDALNTTRNLIGGELNRANNQLKLEPANIIEEMRDAARQAWRSPGMSATDQRDINALTNQALSRIAERVVDDEGNVQWEAKAPLEGKDFANFVTYINQQADSIARKAKFPGVNTQNQLAIADMLHRFSDMAEDASEGPDEAKELRDKARAAYKTYSVLAHAADPTQLSVATPKGVVSELERRAGNADRYRADVAAGDPNATHAETWLKQSLAKPAAPAPVPPPRPPGQWAQRPSAIGQPPGPAPSQSGLPQAIARGATHGALWHLLHPWGYFIGRPVTEAVTRSPGVRSGAATAVRQGANVGARLAGPIAGQVNSQPSVVLPPVTITAQPPTYRGATP